MRLTHDCIMARAYIGIALLITVAACGRIGFDVECPHELCDGFEAAAIDASVWTIQILPAGATVERDTTIAHRGAASVHLHTPAIAAGVDTQARLIETIAPLASDQTYWMRAWYRFDTGSLPAN